MFKSFKSFGSPLAGSKSPTKKDDEETKAEDPEIKRIIITNSGKLHEFYDVDKKKLGEGSYGIVSRCTNKSTGLVCAVKSMSKAKVKDQFRFRREILVMKMMNHPNVVKLYESFEDFRSVYLIIEICVGGELFDRIVEMGNFTETQAAIVMRQILRGIFYMHEIKLTHRDLKPENFLFQTKDPVEKCTLKIVDYGFTCKFYQGKKLRTKAGTPYYVSPEVLRKQYDQSADLWSCGVIMYVLLCGYPPFYGETDDEVLSRVRSGKFVFNTSDWKGVSDDGKDLIKKLLVFDPDKRFTAAQCMDHVWIVNKAPQAQGVPLQVQDNLKSFRSKNKLKKATLNFIASQMDSSKIDSLRSVFLRLDADGDGQLTAAEMREGLANADIELPPHLLEIMEQLEKDGVGAAIDYTEFLTSTLDHKDMIQEDACWAAFRKFDKDGDGKISLEELEEVLNTGSPEDAMDANSIKELMKEADENGDGEIDFDEFMAMMRNSNM